LLTGVVLAYVGYLIQGIFNSFTLRGKNKEIKNSKNEVLELTKRVHQLELENEKLGHSSGMEPEDPNAL
jgi:putative membrane protein